MSAITEEQREGLVEALQRQKASTETLPLSQLLEMKSPYNPRDISEDNIARLRRSLQIFGVAEPICINTRTGHIVGGHQRATAASEEGWKEFPVWYVDMDEPSEKQLNIALNNPNLQGVYDDVKLRVLLDELYSGGHDLTLTGFAEEELALLVGDWDPDFTLPDGLTANSNPLSEVIKIEVDKGDADSFKAALESWLTSVYAPRACPV